MPIKKHRGYSTLDRFPTFRAERRIKMPQVTKRPVRFQTRSIIRKGLFGKDPYWFILHRRGPKRSWIGEDPLEARAVPHDLIRGTLPERIIWKYLVEMMHFVPDVDFDFQSHFYSHKVLTADLRWVEVGKLREGDKLLSFTEDGVSRRGRRNWRVGTVIHNHEELTDSYKITFSDGREIIATAEHPWIVYGDKRSDRLVRGNTQVWAKTSELRPGVEVPVFFRLWEEDTSKDAGWLAGIFDGEGSLVQSESIRRDGTHYANLTVAQRTGKTLSKIKRMIEDKGFKFSVADHRKYKKSYNNTVRDLSEIRIGGGRSEILRFLGAIRPERLLDKLNIDILGDMRPIDKITVISIEPVGKQRICHLGVDCKTYITEGLGSHNSSLQGGRIDTGGIVADFKFFNLRIVLNPLGPTHNEYRRIRKDDEQISALEEMGYQVYMIWESEIYDEFVFDETMKRIFGWIHSGGADTVSDIDDIDSNGFVYDLLYKSVLELRALV